jgi:hypothetical protein
VCGILLTYVLLCVCVKTVFVCVFVSWKTL